MSTERKAVTHTEALELIDAQIGERVQMALFLASANGEAMGTTEG